MEETVRSKCEKWIEMVAKLSIILDINPQIAYLGLTKSLQSKWRSEVRHFSSFVKQLTKQFLDHNWNSLLSLPIRFGYLGIDDPTCSCSLEYDVAQLLCQTFQSGVHRHQLHKLQNKIWKEISDQRQNIFLERLGRVEFNVDQSVNHYIDHAGIKDAWSWLTEFHILKKEVKTQRKQI
ncbi:hypothetical protein GJ496_000485 [Pomphorhynchus laevis]|nr:hypothetical protein GJ496_000485 [Pomphorhynchus laevis]